MYECSDAAQEAFRAMLHIPEPRLREPCSLEKSHLNLALGASNRIQGTRRVSLEDLDTQLIHRELMTRGDTTSNGRNQ